MTTAVAEAGDKKPDEKKASIYETFTKENRKVWLSFNAFATLVSIGMAVGTYLVLSAEPIVDCGGIRLTLWLVFSLHIVNSVEMFINLTGLEKALCSSFWVCLFMIFEVTILIYMQVTYFESQVENLALNKVSCHSVTPLLYFWLMGQILTFYIGIVVVVCYFFRQHCQDPELEARELKKEMDQRAAWELKKKEAEE